METFECITTKLEVREFSTQDVPSEIRSKILEAARLTGTDMNTQHWRFILVEKKDNLKKLAEDSISGSWIAGANFAVIVLTNPKYGFHLIDAGRVLQNMQLAAWNNRVGSGLLTGIREEKLRSDFAIPDELNPVAIVGFGCLSMEGPPYFSQFGEDKWIVDNLPFPSNGVFVDVGASDGVFGNNTYFFERLGWQGLCIDADPSHHASLRANRKLVETCAVSSFRGEIEFYRHNTIPTWSGIYQRGEEYTPIKVQAFTLEDLLALHNISKIDMLSIDVEGSEIDVWNSFKPKLHQPEVIIIEYSDSRPFCRKTDIISVITNYPYRLVHTTPTNLIFVRTPLGWS
jgi:FkbM family methyltransferase